MRHVLIRDPQSILLWGWIYRDSILGFSRNSIRFHTDWIILRIYMHSLDKDFERTAAKKIRDGVGLVLVIGIFSVWA